MKIIRETICSVLSLWHYVSPCFGAHCRYHPTCSQYAIEAIRTQGIFRGTKLAMMRVSRCNSLFSGGIDFLDKELNERKIKG